MCYYYYQAYSVCKHPDRRKDAQTGQFILAGGWEHPQNIRIQRCRRKHENPHRPVCPPPPPTHDPEASDSEWRADLTSGLDRYCPACEYPVRNNGTTLPAIFSIKKDIETMIHNWSFSKFIDKADLEVMEEQRQEIDRLYEDETDNGPWNNAEYVLIAQKNLLRAVWENKIYERKAAAQRLAERLEQEKIQQEVHTMNALADAMETVMDGFPPYGPQSPYWKTREEWEAFRQGRAERQRAQEEEEEEQPRHQQQQQLQGAQNTPTNNRMLHFQIPFTPSRAFTEAIAALQVETSDLAELYARVQAEYPEITFNDICNEILARSLPRQKQQHQSSTPPLATPDMIHECQCHVCCGCCGCYFCPCCETEVDSDDDGDDDDLALISTLCLEHGYYDDHYDDDHRQASSSSSSPLSFNQPDSQIVQVQCCCCCDCGAAFVSDCDFTTGPVTVTESRPKDSDRDSEASLLIYIDGFGYIDLGFLSDDDE
ncbi:hypothetical protein BD289DRAFT_495650 [Coniella lustricola]|uniref:Uncharacterized protein n=1 Tax=Coniella lustricola TaxID=2025994 RepID=A0A2T3ADV8_9PEZI|nr:hypothetical protein BD289DRAFT_495650 [Coniella lustricola]